MNNGIRPSIHELLALRHYAGNIQFFNKNKVHATQAGNRLSIARGRGMDFEEVRRYQPGDDIRLIHWSLTARLGKPFTKIYREERERSVYFVIDQSATMHFGSKVCFKNVMAAKIAALLGWTALQHHEQVGGIVFNNDYAEYIKPKRSRQALLNLFNLLNNNQGICHYNGGLSANLELLSRNLHSGSVVIIISDFFNLDNQTECYLKQINKKAEIINIMVYDPLEVNLPGSGNYSFSNEKGQERLEISSTKNNKELYNRQFIKRLNLIETISRQNQMQFVKIATNDNPLQQINQGILKYGY